MGKISSLPRSIAKERRYFENILYPEKERVGPTAPRPGPILLKQAVAALKLVSIALCPEFAANGSKDKIRKMKAKHITYITK